MSIAASVFFAMLLINLVILTFGHIHCRIDSKMDVFYSVLLGIGATIMVGSGVTWIISH